MGVWDEYCTVCGGPAYVVNYDTDTKEGEPLTPPPPNPADYTWLGSFIGISNKEELIPLASYDSYGGFETQPDFSSPYTYLFLGYRDGGYYLDDDIARGYAVHVACYNLLQQELNYTLKYADVLPLLAENDYMVNTFGWTDYGGLAEYQDQSFMEAQLLQDGKAWMLEDPSREGKNKERILELWRPLVESGFKTPGGTVGDGSRVPEIAELMMRPTHPPLGILGRMSGEQK